MANSDSSGFIFDRLLEIINLEKPSLLECCNIDESCNTFIFSNENEFEANALIEFLKSFCWFSHVPQATNKNYERMKFVMEKTHIGSPALWDITIYSINEYQEIAQNIFPCLVEHSEG